MRNLTFWKKPTVSTLLILSSFFLSAQQVVIENIQTLPENPIKHQSNTNQDGYTKILDENGRKIYYSEQHTSSQTGMPESERNINNITLTIDLIFDPEQYAPPEVILIYDENEGFFPVFWEGINPITIEVPEGEYDVFSEFRDITTMVLTSHIVVKELVNIADNTTIEINVAEAVNYIASDIYNEEGEPLEPGLFDPNTGTTIGGNATVMFDQLFYFAPLDRVPIINSYVWGIKFNEDEDLPWNFYINDISERYSIIQTAIGLGNEGSNYFSKYETLTGVSNSVSQENDPSEWILHYEKFQPSLLGELEPVIYEGFFFHITMDNVTLKRTQVATAKEYDPSVGFKAFLNNRFDDNPVNFLVYPSIVDYRLMIMPPPFPAQDVFIKGNGIVLDENGGVLYGSGNTGFETTYCFCDTGNGYEVLPFHPKFSFTAEENLEIIQGSNTPIFVTAFGNIDIVGIGIRNKGRYGEVRDSDSFTTHFEIKQNGSVIFSGEYFDFLNFSLPAGELEITFTNSNVEVDGLTGKNITQITYDPSEGDAPPTLQMLQFRDTSGKVTDRFASAEEGTVRLAAGDFLNGYFTYDEGNTVEFYYSLYDQDEWTELELTEYPEHFFMPAFGDYYEASLENVAVPEENSWFDVKIVCTDAAGNKQIQTISPAFQISEVNMSIEDVDRTDFAVYPNPFSGDLHIQLPDTVTGDYSFKITDLTGRTVYSENREAGSDKSFVWNGASLSSGVYVCSIVSDGQVVAKRVIKK